MRYLALLALLCGAVFAQDMDLSRQAVLVITTVDNLPASDESGRPYLVTDGNAADPCGSGGGTTKALCVWNAGAMEWQVFGAFPIAFLEPGEPRAVVIEVFSRLTVTATGDGAAWFVVPDSLDGYDLTGIKAQVYEVGTTNTLNVDLARCDAVATGNACSGTVADMLSTNLTIDSNEGRSTTAAAAAVISTSNDDLDVDDVIRIDIDAVHTTPAKGLQLILTFEAP